MTRGIVRNFGTCLILGQLGVEEILREEGSNGSNHRVSVFFYVDASAEHSLVHRLLATVPSSTQCQARAPLRPCLMGRPRDALKQMARSCFFVTAGGKRS
jgi:hypothetical protein